MSKDYYTTLGVHRNASVEAIQRAYHALARKYHPDLNPDDPQAERRFKEIQAAFEVLSDPEQRAAYNRTTQSFATVRKSSPNLGKGAHETEDAVRAFVATRKHSRSRPPASSQRGSEYVYAMVVATVVFTVIVGTFLLALGSPDSQEYPEDDPVLGLVGGLVCCCGTPLYFVVMFGLLANYFKR